MLIFDIKHLFPGFLLSDKNGYAMAKAIEKAMMIFCQTVQDGVDVVQDVEKMPEWRLDEMAWEMGCLYDYNADVESKRVWVRDAVPLFASYGTADALYKVLEGYFDEVEVEENWQYGGQPYHFRITVSGQWTDDNEQWAWNAIAATKNVRSILDDLAIGSAAHIRIGGDTKFWRFPYGMTSANRMTGTQPIENTLGSNAEIRITTAPEAEGWKYPYTPAGTLPQESIVMGAGERDMRVFGDGQSYLYDYPQTRETQHAGTLPQENTVGGVEDALLDAASDTMATVFSYSTAGGNAPCGSDKLF